MNGSPAAAGTGDLLRRRIAAIGRQWWLVALATGLAVSVAAIITAGQPAVYRSSTKIVVGQDGSLFRPEFGNVVQPFTQTMTDLLESEVVARRTIDAMRLELTPRQLIDRIRVTSNPDASVLHVSYDDTDAARATRVLARVADVFTRLVDTRLRPPTRGAVGRHQLPASAAVFDPAHAQPGRVAPHPVRNVLIAGALGVLGGLLLALLRDAWSSRIRGRADAQDAFGAPVVGTLPRGARGRRPVLLGGRDMQPQLADDVLDALALLRANVQFSTSGASHGVVLVTSALPEEGKTTVAANLSVALAAAGSSVITVDADFRRPALCWYLGAGGHGHGLTDLLAGRATLAQSLVSVPAWPSAHLSARNGATAPIVAGNGTTPQLAARNGHAVAVAAPAVAPSRPSRDGRLLLLPLGTDTIDPAELLARGRASRLVGSLRTFADYVVIDTPPLLLVGDAFPLAQLADLVVVVARAGATTRETAEAVRETLQALDVAEFSVVLTDAERERNAHCAYGR